MKNDFFKTTNRGALQSVGNIVVFCSLFAVGVIVLVQNWSATYAGIPCWYVLLPCIVTLLAENAMKIWAAKQYGYKIACYVLDILLLLTVTLFSDGTLISTFYVIILSEFYLRQKSLTGNIVMGACSLGLFLIMVAVKSSLRGEGLNVTGIVTNAFNDVILFALHFLILNFTVQIYRRNGEMNAAIEELRVSHEKLRKLNEELKEITVLEERQRIAREIHDTAGHSLTTVIMQTEAARLVLDTDPEDAKRKIAAANLQARHALEELRESVHLLSGYSEKATLREELLSIIHASADGTGVTIRSEVDEAETDGELQRFLCDALKEGVSNGMRHGGATAFWFELHCTDGEIRFLLTDNGCGVRQGTLREGFGLASMRERAEKFGGKAQFVSEPGEGFEIHLSIPMGKKENV